MQLETQDHLNMCDIIKEYMGYWVYFDKYDEHFYSEEDKFIGEMNAISRITGFSIEHEFGVKQPKTKIVKKKPMDSDIVKNTYISLLEHKDRETAKSLVIQSIKKETEKWYAHIRTANNKIL